MARISIDSFLLFCQSLEGQAIPTRAGRSRFIVRRVDDGIEFTPVSTKKSRLHNRKFIASVLERFESTGSFITTNYRDLTYNASYMLTLIDRYLKCHAS